MSDHLLEFGDVGWASTTKVLEKPIIIETILKGVYDFFFSDINNSSPFLKEAAHVLAKNLTLFLLDQGKVHPGAMTAQRTRKVASEAVLELSPVVDGATFERLKPCEELLL